MNNDTQKLIPQATMAAVPSSIEINTVLAKESFPTVLETYLDQTKNNPNATAIEYQEEKWSYQKLLEKSLYISTSLLNNGVKPGQIICIAGSRSPEFIASMFAVWISEAAFVCLGEEQPIERKELMLKESKAEYIILTEKNPDLELLVNIESEFQVIKTYEIDRSSDQFHNVDGKYDITISHDLAYIFFTSGSTGTPKGVKGSHTGLAHFIAWQRNTFHTGPGDRISHLTALSFDPMLREVLLPLTSGGTLCIPDKNHILEPRKILQWLQYSQISILHCVPSLAQIWLTGNLHSTYKLNNLRLIFFAGEPLHSELVLNWRMILPDNTKIVNLYGPTETTLTKCFKILDSHLSVGIQSIGTPIPGTQVLILNKENKICDINETGQIAIRTPYKSHGYIDTQQENNKVFIKNSWTNDKNDFIYLTGDLGKINDNSEIEIFGRIDDQIKIRGIRIEPKEIETAIKNSSSDIQDSLVIGQSKENGNKYLIAYIVISNNGISDNTSIINELRKDLISKLPEAMIPTAFVILEKIPLLPNGKVNKKQLPKPDKNAFFTSKSSIKPETKNQKILYGIWKKLLENTSFGIDDDFFFIGGNSLLAVQMVLEIEQYLKKDCPIGEIFRLRTIRNICNFIEKTPNTSSKAEVIKLQNIGEGTPLFCLVGLDLYQHLADALKPDIPVYGIFLPKEMDFFKHPYKQSTELSMTSLATDYLKIIKKVQPHGPYMLTGLSFGGILAYEVAQQLTEQGEKISFLCILDSLLPGTVKTNYKHKIKSFFKNRIIKQSKLLAYSLRIKYYIFFDKEYSINANNLKTIRNTIYSKAESAYKPKTYNGKVVLVKATDSRWAGLEIKPDLGWRNLVTDLTVIKSPGDHLGIISKVNASKLASKLKPLLIKARNY